MRLLEELQKAALVWKMLAAGVHAVEGLVAVPMVWVLQAVVLLV